MDDELPPGWVRTRYDEEKGWLWRRATEDELREAEAAGIPVHLMKCDNDDQ